MRSAAVVDARSDFERRGDVDPFFSCEQLERVEVDARWRAESATVQRHRDVEARLCALDVGPRAIERAIHGRCQVREAVEIAAQGRLIDHVAAGRDLKVRRRERGREVPGATRDPRLGEPVRDVEPTGIDERGAHVEPAHRAEEPSPMDVEVACRAHGVYPDFAHVVGVHPLEPHRPQIVVEVGEVRRLHPRDRRIGEARHGGECVRRGGRVRRHSLAYAEREPVAVNARRVKASMREIREGNAKVAVVEVQDPLDAAVPTANRQPLDVHPPGNDRVRRDVVDDKLVGFAAEEVPEQTRLQKDVHGNEIEHPRCDPTHGDDLDRPPQPSSERRRVLGQHVKPCCKHGTVRPSRVAARWHVPRTAVSSWRRTKLIHSMQGTIGRARDRRLRDRARGAKRHRVRRARGDNPPRQSTPRCSSTLGTSCCAAFKPSSGTSRSWRSGAPRRRAT